MDNKEIYNLLLVIVEDIKYSIEQLNSDTSQLTDDIREFEKIINKI